MVRGRNKILCPNHILGHDMAMRKNPSFDVLIPYCHEHLDYEGRLAERMFRKFVTNEFSYDDISNHPDYMSFASAEMLAFMLPLMIDEMLTRKDTDNFLIHQIIGSIAPFVERATDPLRELSYAIYDERFHDMALLINEQTKEKFCAFVSAIKAEQPMLIAQLERISAFWKCPSASELA